jgi:hypothetical protein
LADPRYTSFDILRALQEADTRGLSGDERRAFMVAQSPLADSLTLEEMEVPENTRNGAPKIDVFSVEPEQSLC